MGSVSEYKEFQKENLLGYIQALPPREGLIGPGILPDKEVDDWKQIWDVVDVKVTAGHLVGLDAEVPLDSPPAIKEIMQSLAKIAKKRLISEEEKMKLFRPRPGSKDLARGEEYVYNCIRLLSEGLDDRMEHMRWAALGDGLFSYDKYGIKVEVDFGLPEANQVTASPLWSDTANADPLTDILTWSDVLVDALGAGPVIAFASTKVMRYLLDNSKIRNLIGYSQTGKGKGFPSKPMVESFLLNGQGLPINVYDRKYNEEAENGNITVTRYLAENKFVLLGSAAGLSPMGLGQMALGPVPSNNMESGKSVNVYTLYEPYREIMVAEVMAFPMVFVPQAILQATVA